MKYLLNKLRIAQQRAAAEKAAKKSDVANETVQESTANHTAEESIKDDETQENVSEPKPAEQNDDKVENDTHQFHDESEL